MSKYKYPKMIRKGLLTIKVLRMCYKEIKFRKHYIKTKMRIEGISEAEAIEEFDIVFGDYIVDRTSEICDEYFTEEEQNKEIFG